MMSIKNFWLAYIEKAARFTNGEDLKIYINPSDARQKGMAGGTYRNDAYESARRDFVGGVRAVVKGRNVLS